MLGLAWDIKLPRFMTEVPPAQVIANHLPDPTPAIGEELLRVASGD